MAGDFSFIKKRRVLKLVIVFLKRERILIPNFGNLFSTNRILVPDLPSSLKKPSLVLLLLKFF